MEEFRCKKCDDLMIKMNKKKGTFIMVGHIYSGFKITKDGKEVIKMRMRCIKCNEWNEQ